MTLTRDDLRHALRELDLAGQAVFVHSSLRSFGYVSGGAEAVVRAFLDEDCTMLVPTFSSAFEIAPPCIYSLCVTVGTTVLLKQRHMTQTEFTVPKFSTSTATWARSQRR